MECGVHLLWLFFYRTWTSQLRNAQLSWGLWVEYPKFPFFIDRITMGGIPEKKIEENQLVPEENTSTVMIMRLSMIMLPPKQCSWQSRRTPETNSSCPRKLLAKGDDPLKNFGAENAPFQGLCVPVLLHFREDLLIFQDGRAPSGDT